MRPDEGTRARLTLLARREPPMVGSGLVSEADPPAGLPSGGWVPGPPPAEGAGAGAGHRAGDGDDSGDQAPVGGVPPAGRADSAGDCHPETDPLRIRDRALASAVAAYTAAYGHPLHAESIDPRSHRWAMPGRVMATAVVVLVVLGGVVVARAAQQSPAEVVALEEALPDAIPPAAEVEPMVVVHVVGQVVRPGLVTLPAGARVSDVIEAAGGAGAEADLAAVNLARTVTDGEQILVPRPGEAVPEVGGGGAANGLVNLNLADAGTLETLPGIGPVLAERIVDWREDHGRFTSVEELTEVSGIGPALLEGVRDLVSVG